MSRVPEEIAAEEHEQVTERVCAIDVARASGKVCTRVPHESAAGRRVTRVWDVDAAASAITGLGDHLAAQKVELVTVEAGLGLLADLLLPAGSIA